MSDPTPEELLALARECMPNDGWGQTTNNEIVIWPSNDECERFDPIGNPAHAWAVETWLFDPMDKPYDICQKDADHSDPYYINWNGDFDEQTFPDNLSAAIAVLRKRGGK